MKLFKRLSVFLALAIVFGAMGMAAPQQVEAQNPVKFSVLEFISSAG
ncbi:MAG TPA: hypothetical protein PLW45_04185 [Anaerolineaceae bacterium]|nr:hypothetical protein [Anaerolineaceae bacterium]HQL92431.1 hypothetical protein [Anaerolineaceae bacterium]